MLTKTYGKNSWHYRLATHYTLMDKYEKRELERDGTDLCSYTRKVMLGVFVAATGTAAAGLIAGCVADFFVWLYVGLINSYIEPDPYAIVTIIIIASAGVIGAIIGLRFAYIAAREKYQEKHPESVNQPSFVTDAYRSAKHKYCFKINFSGENKTSS